MRRGREQRSRPFGMNKEIVHGSGARRLMGGHGRPGLYECVYIHKMMGPLGAPGLVGWLNVVEWAGRIHQNPPHQP